MLLVPNVIVIFSVLKENKSSNGDNQERVQFLYHKTKLHLLIAAYPFLHIACVYYFVFSKTVVIFLDHSTALEGRDTNSKVIPQQFLYQECSVEVCTNLFLVAGSFLLHVLMHL